jgi:hypothetical protein
MKSNKNLILIMLFTLIACLQIGLSMYRDEKALETIKREEAKKQIFDDDDFRQAEVELTSLVQPIMSNNNSTTNDSEEEPVATIDIADNDDQELEIRGNTCYKHLKEAIISNESKPETYFELSHNVDIQSPRCIVVTIEYNIVNYDNKKFRRRCIGTSKYSGEGKESVSISDVVIQRY